MILYMSAWKQHEICALFIIQQRHDEFTNQSGTKALNLDDVDPQTPHFQLDRPRVRSNPRWSPRVKHIMGSAARLSSSSVYQDQNKKKIEIQHDWWILVENIGEHDHNMPLHYIYHHIYIIYIYMLYKLYIYII